MGWNLYATEQLTALAAKVDVSLDALESINDDNARPILDAMLDEFSELITVMTEDASPALNKLAWACFTAADVVPTGPSAPHATDERDWAMHYTKVYLVDRTTVELKLTAYADHQAPWAERFSANYSAAFKAVRKEVKSEIKKRKDESEDRADKERTGGASQKRKRAERDQGEGSDDEARAPDFNGTAKAGASVTERLERETRNAQGQYEGSVSTGRGDSDRAKVATQLMHTLICDTRASPCSRREPQAL